MEVTSWRPGAVDCTVQNEHHRTYVVFFSIRKILVLVWDSLRSNNLGFSVGYVLAYGCTWYQRALPCQLRGSPPRTHNNRAAVRDNCGQRKRGCTCCLIDRVTAASKTEGVPAVSSIESLMIRRPFGSIDPNSIRETELHKESRRRQPRGEGVPTQPAASQG